jgi:hypothetical protein
MLAEIARLTIAPVPRVGNPSTGQIANQASHVTTAATAARLLSTGGLIVGVIINPVNAVRHSQS